MAAKSFVVRSDDFLHAVVTKLIGAELCRLTGLEGNVALDGIGLHERDAEDEYTQTDVRDRHAGDAGRQAQVAAQPLERIDQRREDDPQAHRGADRRQWERMRVDTQAQRQSQHH